MILNKPHNTLPSFNCKLQNVGNTNQCYQVTFQNRGNHNVTISIIQELVFSQQKRGSKHYLSCQSNRLSEKKIKELCSPFWMSHNTSPQGTLRSPAKIIWFPQPCKITTAFLLTFMNTPSVTKIIHLKNNWENMF